ncbi:hypothetical protein GCM10008018_47940 [Paenibacillus marchantiophytorum]|uniref:DUF2306 domain-containing protein n=1 Tax=Paenibacillus marchantiophytorum TaxID=1619310 RepID=A0ABQ1F1N4_9BACL|nr:DUF2306 domain-containing protein [Paenibacillus marchantiophytorum]GFZ95946.1 hypothetical protein GCM10008018_47940 [Paenibacillus marchantiophytorum]
MAKQATSKKNYIYPLVLTVLILYMAYVTLMNLFVDPQATVFLSRKIDLKRPMNLPIWLDVMHIHVGAACLAMLTGILNFSQTLLRSARKFHRVNGYLYVIAVFVVVLTSGYMAPYTTGGKINSVAFNLVSMVWFAMTIAAIVQIKRKNIIKHRKWMVRSYLFCFTNLFIHLISFILYEGAGLKYELSYTMGVYGAILLNFILAELVIRFVYRKTPNVAVQANRKEL